jgi:hypothetical protein
MNNYLKKSIYLLTVCFFCYSLFFNISCASSKSNKFHSKIQKMSDNDLLNYYHGINDRIKDIDNDIKREESPDQTEIEQVTSNMSFMFGGEGYNLVQKRKMILKELNSRSLTP